MPSTKYILLSLYILLPSCEAVRLGLHGVEINEKVMEGNLPVEIYVSEELLSGIQTPFFKPDQPIARDLRIWSFYGSEVFGEKTGVCAYHDGSHFTNNWKETDLPILSLSNSSRTMAPNFAGLETQTSQLARSAQVAKKKEQEQPSLNSFVSKERDELNPGRIVRFRPPPNVGSGGSRRVEKLQQTIANQKIIGMRRQAIAEQKMLIAMEKMQISVNLAMSTAVLFFQVLEMKEQAHKAVVAARHSKQARDNASAIDQYIRNDLKAIGRSAPEGSVLHVSFNKHVKFNVPPYRAIETADVVLTLESPRDGFVHASRALTIHKAFGKPEGEWAPPDGYRALDPDAIDLTLGNNLLKYEKKCFRAQIISESLGELYNRLGEFK